MAVMKGAGIGVIGLDQFRKDLKHLADTGLTDELKDANLAVAQLIVQSATARATTRLQRAAARTLKASRTAARAQVTLGSAKVPQAVGAEFGSGRGQLRTGPSGRRYQGHNQFMAWRGNGGSAGYFLYPAIRSENDEILELYADEMKRIADKAFPDG